jgi:hypothetical protein
MPHAPPRFAAEILLALTHTVEEMAIAQKKTAAAFNMALAHLRPADSPLSDTGLGQHVHDTLKRLRRIVKAEGGEGDPVLTHDQLEVLKACPREKDVVEFLTPFLDKLCVSAGGDSCPAILVNSEELEWLAQPGTHVKFKPDLFLSWTPFVTFHKLVGKGVVARAGSHFGRLGGAALQYIGCVGGLCEAKRENFKVTHFGELCRYHACLKDAVCLGMVFDNTKFWLYESAGRNPSELIQAVWGQPGAGKSVSDFFSRVQEPQLLVLLRALLRDLDVEPVHINGVCYLGSGAYGHAFTVQRRGTGPGAAPLALKAIITTPARVSHVANEFTTLQRAAAQSDRVVGVAGDLQLRAYGSLGDGSFAGGGFLLASVGEPFAVSVQRDCVRAFEALADLHAAGVVHGDPRVPNLVCVGRELKWIDLSASALAFTAASLCADAAMLARSVLALPRECVFPDAVAEAVGKYAAADKGTVAALAAAVWAEAECLKLAAAGGDVAGVVHNCGHRGGHGVVAAGGGGGSS